MNRIEEDVETLDMKQHKEFQNFGIYLFGLFASFIITISIVQSKDYGENQCDRIELAKERKKDT